MAYYKQTMKKKGNVQGQIFEHIFAPNGGCRVYNPSNILRHTCSFDTRIISLRYSPVLAGV